MGKRNEYNACFKLRPENSIAENKLQINSE